MDFSKATRCSEEAAKAAVKVSFPEPAAGSYNVTDVAAMMVDNPDYDKNIVNGKHLDKDGKYEVDAKIVYLEFRVDGQKRPLRLTPWQLTRQTSDGMGLDASMSALDMERELPRSFTFNVSKELGTIITSKNTPKQYKLWSRD